MSESTNISWTHHTRNFWTGCTKVSPACAHCYAETMAKRNSTTFGQWGRGAPRKWHGETARADLIRWNRKAVAAGERRLVFLNSMSDWLDDEVPIEWLMKLLDAIRITPHLTHLLLTKRPENFRPRLEAILAAMPRNGITLQQSAFIGRIEVMLRGWNTYTYISPELGRENYWIGTTVEDQARADERIPHLLDIPATTRFLSCEPLLEALEFSNVTHRKDSASIMGKPALHGIHWVIVGGESGAGHRHFDHAWARSIRDQCTAAGIPFHMKQMGGFRPSSMTPIPEDLLIRQWPALT